MNYESKGLKGKDKREKEYKEMSPNFQKLLSIKDIVTTVPLTKELKAGGEEIKASKKMRSCVEHNAITWGWPEKL